METLQPYLISIAIIFIFSAFVKCMTVFSIFRYGLGFYGSGIGLVLFILSFCLSVMILSPQIEESGGLDGVFNPKITTVAQLSQQYTPVLTKYTDSTVQERFLNLAVELKQKSATPENEGKTEISEESRFSVLVSSYIVSEVKKAFEIGFFLLIPFLVLDLVVANVLLLLGANNIQHQVISLPLKILLFFAVDGWQLLSEKLISTYMG